jgi:Putative transmembrane protein (PGPGW)
MPRTLRRVAVFVAGLVSIVTGLVLIVLPGPLTIPPILFGVWLWSLEFEFARRWLRPLRDRGAAARQQAREKPVHTTAVTVLGLVAAAVVVWATFSYDLIERGRQLVGLS